MTRGYCVISDTHATSLPLTSDTQERNLTTSCSEKQTINVQSPSVFVCDLLRHVATREMQGTWQLLPFSPPQRQSRALANPAVIHQQHYDRCK
ncbi:hypothetical protein Q7C36_015854 [Tachysurus vachellii]|uniref:Uncharacterized protein n=1 Tax=Tachysurus vachellii TaxID=175792 RepID=A0AA88M7J0_TACVA|nr:hypothetical protein Q7C36_015854 [Tachysurus vachellii]